MGYEVKSLKDWCDKNNKDDILNEWDADSNGNTIQTVSIRYNSPIKVNWKCKEGHQWYGPIVSRTLFNRGCPICNPINKVLPVGTKYGCLTIIGDYSVYNSDEKIKEIERLREEMEWVIEKRDNVLNNKIMLGYTNMRIKSLGEHIEYLSNNEIELYQCRCKCGLIHFMSEDDFLEKKHRYCTESSRKQNKQVECGLLADQRKKLLDQYERVFDKSYDINLTNTLHEQLQILDCVDNHYEELTSWTDKRKKGGGTYTVYKKYKCRCYLCGKEYIFKSQDFHISPPTPYGEHAYHGYYSDAYCDCHKIQQFQWVVNKILKENNISYRVEVQFPDLLGIGRTNFLRYDFAIINPDNTVKYFIECQGEQHYKTVAEFGGSYAFQIQQKNDEIKRKYAAEHNVKLLEIPYTIKKPDKVEKFLRENQVI